MSFFSQRASEFLITAFFARAVRMRAPGRFLAVALLRHEWRRPQIRLRA